MGATRQSSSCGPQAGGVGLGVAAVGRIVVSARHAGHIEPAITLTTQGARENANAGRSGYQNGYDSDGRGIEDSAGIPDKWQCRVISVVCRRRCWRGSIRWHRRIARTFQTLDETAQRSFRFEPQKRLQTVSALDCRHALRRVADSRRGLVLWRGWRTDGNRRLHRAAHSAQPRGGFGPLC